MTKKLIRFFKQCFFIDDGREQIAITGNEYELEDHAFFVDHKLAEYVEGEQNVQVKTSNASERNADNSVGPKKLPKNRQQPRRRRSTTNDRSSDSKT